MSTIAAVGADMLRAAAVFFRAVGAETPHLAEQLEANAKAYEDVARLLESDPTMTLPNATTPLHPRT